MAKQPTIILIGRFPPPSDGQALATQRLLSMLEGEYEVHTVNTMIAHDIPAVQKIKGYVAAGRHLHEMLDAHPAAIVIWTSISPQVSGHWRDRLTIMPRLNNRRVIAVVHWGSFARLFTQRGTSTSSRHSIKRLSRIVFTADLLADECASWIPISRRRVIPNSLDPLMVPLSETVKERIKQGPSSPLNVLFLSNMYIEKGWEDVLTALAELKDRLSVMGTFAGAWPDETLKQRFHRRVDELGLKDHVNVHGAVTNREEVARLHLKADVFILPSWLGEAQPLSILEAMAAGTPCIVSDAGAMPGMIGPTEAGRVVPAKNPTAISEAIASLVNTEEWTRCATAARHRFDAHYDKDVIQAEWMALVEDISNAGGAA